MSVKVVALDSLNSLSHRSQRCVRYFEVGFRALSTYAKFFNISYQHFLPPKRTRTCAYQGVRNVSFSENFADVLNE